MKRWFSALALGVLLFPQGSMAQPIVPPEGKQPQKEIVPPPQPPEPAEGIAPPGCFPAFVEFTVTKLEPVKTVHEIPVRKTITEKKEVMRPHVVLETKPVYNTRAEVVTRYRTVEHEYCVPVQVTKLVPCVTIDKKGRAVTTYKTETQTIMQTRVGLKLVSDDEVVKYETAALSTEVQQLQRKSYDLVCREEIKTEKVETVHHVPVTKVYRVPSCAPAMCVGCAPLIK